MILEIIKYPAPILRRKSEAVKEITPEIKELARDMMETVKNKDGAGLAASQIGELKRLITVHIAKEPVVLINPKIIKKSRESAMMEEGCLSFPDLWLKIKRTKEVEIEALNMEGKKIQIKAQGLLARVLQHEIDHLDGILFIDRLSFFQRLKLKKKLCR